MKQVSSHQDKHIWAHYQAALKIARILNDEDFEAYLIGGAVRDILIGRLPKDFDIVTNARPEQLLKLPGLKQSSYQDPAQAFGVSRLKVEVKVRDQTLESEVEVATYRRDIEAHLGRKQTKVEFADLVEDLRRRDFTINALALDLVNDCIVDLNGGIEDLEAKIVRFIGDPAERLNEDPLRLLRGIRLKVQLSFKFDVKTESAIREAVKNGAVKDIAVERSRDELTRMLTHPTRHLALGLLNDMGVVKTLIPEIDKMHGVQQPPEFHSEGDVWRHTLLAMEHLPGKVSKRLAWATLLHDVGKPPTFEPKEQTGDRIRFSEHYRVGAEMAREILNRLKFSKKFVSEVSWMIENHLGVDDLPRMKPTRAEYFMAQPAFEDLLEMHKADAQASWNLRPDGRVSEPNPDFKELHRMWDEFKAKQRQHPPVLADIAVDGNWLWNEFEIEDGPRLGLILDQLKEAYLDGEIKNKNEAKKLAERLIKSKPTSAS